MKMTFNSRKWHAWLSFALAIPILLVAATAIFMAHGSALGLRDISVPARWLPSYARENKTREVRTLWQATDSLWIGTETGLYRKSATGVAAVAAFDGQEIRALLPTTAGLLVLSTQGLFAQYEQRWQRVGRAPVLSAYVDNGVVYAVFRGASLQASRDGGRTWAPAAGAQTLLAELPPLSAAAATLTLAKVIRDIHTGAVFLGRDTEWIWSDSIGGVLLFLVLSGLYLWWRGQRRLVFSRRVNRR